jgi:hypothetical protein
MKIYLAGPMSGYPQFNFPLFYKAAALLRADGWNVVSPAELDADTDAEIPKAALASPDGKHINKGVAGHTWGDLLARDVKMLADDGINGIIFLPDWHKSRGARLEAFTGTQIPGFKFYRYLPTADGESYNTRYIEAESVMIQLAQYTNEYIRANREKAA